MIKFGDLVRLNLVEFAYAFLKSIVVSFVSSKSSIFIEHFLSLFKFQRLYKEAEIKTKTYLKL